MRLGAVAAKHGGDDESLRYYLAQFQQVLLTIELELRLFTFEVVIVVIYLLFIYGLKCNSWENYQFTTELVKMNLKLLLEVYEW